MDANSNQNGSSSLVVDTGTEPARWAASGSTMISSIASTAASLTDVSASRESGSTPSSQTCRATADVGSCCSSAVSERAACLRIDGEESWQRSQISWS
eukprot:scaffold199460_cov27-Tisochrysis_lutea.AAC.5